MNINIRAEIREVMKTCRDVPRQEIPRRAMLALNLAIRKVNKDIRKDVSKGMGLKPTEVGRAMKVFRAKATRLITRLSAKGRPLPLAAFNSTRQLSGGVASLAYGQRKLYPHTFIATMKSGHRGVFRRVVSGGRRVPRLKINELFGPSVPATFVEPDNVRRMQEVGTRAYMVEFSRLMRLGSRLSLKGGSFRGK